MAYHYPSLATPSRIAGSSIVPRLALELEVLRWRSRRLWLLRDMWLFLVVEKAATRVQYQVGVYLLISLKVLPLVSTMVKGYQLWYIMASKITRWQIGDAAVSLGVPLTICTIATLPLCNKHSHINSSSLSTLKISKRSGLPSLKIFLSTNVDIALSSSTIDIGETQGWKLIADKLFPFNSNYQCTKYVLYVGVPYLYQHYHHTYTNLIIKLNLS